MKIGRIVTSLKMLLFVIAVFFGNSGTVYAGNTGKITGAITDNDGNPLFGVNISVVGQPLGATTDADGIFFILNVPPGSYELLAEYIGYASKRVQDVRVSVDLTTKQNFRLREQAVEGEEVVVVAERPMIIVDQTSSAASISSEQLASLPVEDVFEAITLQTGVVQSADGGIHIRGGRASEVQYIVDGVPVTDQYSGTLGVSVENNAIQELTLVSGTFNAEYGEAQSGIVNITTKAGGDKYQASLQSFAGSYFTNDNLYTNLDEIRPSGIFDLTGSLSGPVPGLGKKVTFFASGRRFDDDGYLWGQRVFNLSDTANFSGPNETEWEVFPTGDNEFVPMEYRRTWSFNGKLSYQVSPTIQATLSGLWNDENFRIYDHQFKYNPDGDYERVHQSNSLIFNWNHVINKTTVYDVRAARVFSENSFYVFENPVDNRFPTNDLLERVEPNFAIGGAKNIWENRSTQNLIGKMEITSQVNPVHLVKAGVEAKQYELDFLQQPIINNDKTGFLPSIDPQFSDIDAFNVKPFSFAAYIQDKIELDYMVVNLGVRYDHFDASSGVPSDLTDPENSPKLDNETKSQVSPRLGIAYPISSRGVLYFSYGHFFQLPPFEFLFSNPEFETGTGGFNEIIGNADLEAEQTVAYEFGLQQQVSDQIVLNVVGFNKDIRNLLGTEVLRTFRQVSYARYVNRDYGNVRGVTLSVEKRRTGDLIAANLDYTFSVAEGNASDPRAVFFDNQSVPPLESEIQQVPLDWDQRHTLNLSVRMGRPGWNIGLISRLNSGQPYTPDPFGRRTTQFGENSEKKPATWIVDLLASKNFGASPKFTAYFKVFNLLDRRNPIDVFTSTGSANSPLVFGREEIARKVIFSDLDDVLTRPDFYSPPREIRIGLGVSF